MDSCGLRRRGHGRTAWSRGHGLAGNERHALAAPDTADVALLDAGFRTNTGHDVAGRIIRDLNASPRIPRAVYGSRGATDGAIFARKLCKSPLRATPDASRHEHGSSHCFLSRPRRTRAPLSDQRQRRSPEMNAPCRSPRASLIVHVRFSALVNRTLPSSNVAPTSAQELAVRTKTDGNLSSRGLALCFRAVLTNANQGIECLREQDRV